jgi:hypothetical protein
MTLTPRVIRVLDLSEDDLRPFRVGDNATAPLSLPVPVPLPAPIDRAPVEREPPAGVPTQPPSPLPNASPILPPPAQPPPR